MQSRKPATGFILLTLFLDVLGFGLLIPVAPRLVQQLHGGNEQAVAPIVGLLMATYAVMQFFFAPVLGALSDRFGRRPVLLTALFGSGLDYFIQPLSPTLWILFLTRAINGMSGASFSVANAYIADVTPPEKRAAAFGMSGAAFGLGFIFGPIIGGVLGRYDIHYPFYAAGTVTLLNWLYGYFILPESLSPQNVAKFSFRRANPIGVFRGMAKYPLVVELAASFLLLNLAQFGLHATWVLYTGYRYGWTPLDVGISLAAVGVGAAFVQAVLARKIIPWLGEPRSLLIGIAIGCLAYVGYGAATSGWMIYVVIAGASLGGIAQPAAQSLITRTVRPDEQGATQGALSALSNVSSIIGPIIGTGIFAYFTSESAPVKIPGAAFFSSAILCGLGLIVAAWAVARHAVRLPVAPQEPAAVVTEAGPAGDAAL